MDFNMLLGNSLKASKEILRPICGCNFLVIFGGTKVPFSKISGIGYKNEVEYLIEGGRNDMALMLKSQIKEGIKLTFERGVMNSGAATSLKKLVKKLREIEVQVKNNKGDIIRTYFFPMQGLLEYQLGDLDASKSEVLIEKIVISTYRDGLTYTI